MIESTPAESQSVQLDRLYQWINDVREQFSHEIDQALLKRDLYLGIEALGGRDACDRLKRQIECRFQMDRNHEEQAARPPKMKAPMPSWYRPQKQKRSVG
jgi:hypothetical protein